MRISGVTSGITRWGGVALITIELTAKDIENLAADIDESNTDAALIEMMVMTAKTLLLEKVNA